MKILSNRRTHNHFLYKFQNAFSGSYIILFPVNKSVLNPFETQILTI